MKWLKRLIAAILIIIAIIAVILLTIISFGGTIAVSSAAGSSIFGFSVGSSGFLASTAALLAEPVVAVATLAGTAVLSGTLAYAIDSDTARGVINSVSEFISDAASSLMGAASKTVTKGLPYVLIIGGCVISGIFLWRLLFDSKEEKEYSSQLS